MAESPVIVMPVPIPADEAARAQALARAIAASLWT